MSAAEADTPHEISFYQIPSKVQSFGVIFGRMKNST